MLRLLVLATLSTAVHGPSSIKSCTMALQCLDFEVFGRVQGVFFRKFTKEKADQLGLKGWCMNTSNGTVEGHIEGPNDKIRDMIQWLKTTGSPSSQIEKTEFKNQKDITEYSFEGFTIRKSK